MADKSLEKAFVLSRLRALYGAATGAARNTFNTGERAAMNLGGRAGRAYATGTNRGRAAIREASNTAGNAAAGRMESQLYPRPKNSGPRFLDVRDAPPAATAAPARGQRLVQTHTADASGRFRNDGPRFIDEKPRYRGNDRFGQSQGDYAAKTEAIKQKAIGDAHRAAYRQTESSMTEQFVQRGRAAGRTAYRAGLGAAGAAAAGGAAYGATQLSQAQVEQRRNAAKARWANSGGGSRY